jgi:hypothetical protein
MSPRSRTPPSHGSEDHDPGSAVDLPDLAEGLCDPEVLRSLRDEVLTLVGPEHAFGVLYGSGFREGMLEGLRVARSFQGTATPVPHVTAPDLAIPLRPDPAHQRLAGSSRCSRESQLPAPNPGPAGQPGCAVTAGFTAGWYSALLDARMLAREVECVARGDAACRFDARSFEDWTSADPVWTEGLTLFLDVEKLRERAVLRLTQAHEALAPTSDNFDPATGAAHVWGPVLVLPWAGIEDAECSLAAIWGDPIAETLEVAVVDVASAHIGDAETVGLLRLLDQLGEACVETIFAGMRPETFETLSESCGAAQRPLLSPDITSAIALAFQLCAGTRG